MKLQKAAPASSTLNIGMRAEATLRPVLADYRRLREERAAVAG